MDLVACYRLLGLDSQATPEAVKQAYRRLARQYHPDANPDNRVAQEHFVRLTAAYRHLLATIEPETPQRSPQGSPRPAVPVQGIPQLTAAENQLKWESYQKLQQLLAENRFARAITLLEGLAQRLPQDAEVRQWQAILYHQWGLALVDQGKHQQGKNYLKKALRTDPHNRVLWQTIEAELAELANV
jgi:tetratricopeptide (TPR) repeat protein